jgi:2-hydroxy-6-oxonona-2,4-dienedioate hydrolase
MVWHVWDGGTPDALPLVLLHGDFGSWTHWVRNVLPLSRHFRVLVPDMPGYGASDLPPEPWSPASLARIIGGGIGEILGASARYSVAGFSFGGIIAGHLAALEKDRVDRLVLLGPGGLGLPGARDAPALRRVQAGMGAPEIRAVHRHNLLALMIADPGKADDLAVDLQMANIGGARLRAGAIPASDVLLRILPTVRARLSGIWGGRDAFVFPHVRERGDLLRRFQPDIDFRTIEGAGHWTPYEAPGAVNAALTEMMGEG